MADVVYVLPDKLGGVVSFCDNLLRYRRPEGLRHGAVLTHNRRAVDVRSGDPMAASWQAAFEYSPDENLYAVLRRLNRLLAGSGALVANDWIELAAVAAHGGDRTVFSICHMDAPYYFDLAVRHEPDIDVYVTYTEYLRQRLVELLPHRASSVVLRRYGVRISAARRAQPGPLRLLYSGRIDRHKGVFDLPAIDAAVRRAGVDVAWTIQGTGPDADELRAAWPRADVTWTGRRDIADVLKEYERQDVLVMPSRHEGLPVALLEAGAAGMVPVVSDLRSGIPEVVTNGTTGFRLPTGDTEAFAAAIVSLHHDRDGLERMGTALRRLVSRDWNIETNAPGYQELFEDWRARRRPARPVRPLPYGSRLDRPWIPNALVKAVRRSRRQ